MRRRRPKKRHVPFSRLPVGACYAPVYAKHILDRPSVRRVYQKTSTTRARSTSGADYHMPVSAEGRREIVVVRACPRIFEYD